jgi:hypothetical protein
MTRRRGVACLFIFLLAAGGTSHGRGVEGFGNLPLAFEPNRGQTDPRVAFLARGAGFQLFVTPTHAVYKIDVACTDDSGNRALRTVVVAVPRQK